ncbi:PAS domain S-box protein [Thalassobellus citreus]|uniref:PAS domain S-box protein n=1 Tax=Thalassobellus citreus TaxID=3367752 RepID=UPI0037B4D88A
MIDLDYDQILILLFQCLIVATLLLGLFKLRSIFGLGVLFTALGVFQYMQVFLTSSIYFQVAPDIFVSPGNILFAGSLFAILLIYIREDALEARKVIYAIVAANFVLSLMQYVISFGIEKEGVLNIYNLPRKFFAQQTRVLVVGNILLFFDAFIVIFIFEKVSKYISNLFFQIFFSIVIVLSFDSLFFSIGVFWESDQFLIPGVISKISAALVYAVLFTLYLIYIDKVPVEGDSDSFKDIFYKLTYRQKFEKVSKERDIQEIKLQSTEDRMKTYFDEAPLGVSIVNSLTGDVYEINQKFLEIIGRSKDEISAINWKHITHPDDMQENLDHMVKIQKGESTGFSMDKRYVKPDQTNVWVSLTVAALKVKDKAKPMHLSMVQDITKQKRTQEKIIEEKNKTKKYLDVAGVILLSLDASGKVRLINPKGCKVLGYEEKEIIGKNWFDNYLPEDQRSEVKSVFEKNFNKERVSAKQYENKILTKSGEEKVIAWKNEMITDTEGTIVAILSSGEDVTEKKKAEEELKKHQEHLEELVKERTHALSNSQQALLNLVDDLNEQSLKIEGVNKQLAIKNDELESFSYSVSHDLRAPLRHIDGFSNLLHKSLKGKLNEKEENYFKNIVGSSSKMNELIDGLLIYSRMGRSELKKTTINMKTLVDDVIQTFVFDIKKNEITIIVDDMPNASVDVFLMKQVWENLISNAVKFSSKTKTPKIHIGYNKDVDGADIYYVKDNGVGFDQKYVGKVFGVFQRLHSVNEFSGTGIGLATAKRIILKHQGEIWAEGTDKGASFFFKLPI